MKCLVTLLMVVAVLAGSGCAAPDESARRPQAKPAPPPQAYPVPPPPAKVAAPPPPAAPARPPVKALPEFPWPPPQPSTHVVLDNALLRADGKPPATLGAVNNRLERALNRSGYEYSYYRTANGFALVARLERIRDDGTPQPEEFRFLQPGVDEPFSLATYIKRLFFAPAGLYRMIVFVATDQAIVGWGKPLDTEAATGLLRQGASGLTSDIEGLPWSADHSVTTLIYEFRKVARDSEPKAIRPSRLSGHTHLERARIRAALASPQ